MQLKEQVIEDVLAGTFDVRKAAAAYKKSLELRPNYPEAAKALAALK